MTEKQYSDWVKELSQKLIEIFTFTEEEIQDPYIVLMIFWGVVFFAGVMLLFRQAFII